MLDARKDLLKATTNDMCPNPSIKLKSILFNTKMVKPFTRKYKFKHLDFRNRRLDLLNPDSPNISLLVIATKETESPKDHTFYKHNLQS